KASPAPSAPGQPVSARDLAESLFRTGDCEGALRAYNSLDPNALKVEERLEVQYMIATCLRKLGKTEDAGNLYREVANARGDEMLADCARWQLSAMSWHRDMENDLARLRQR